MKSTLYDKLVYAVEMNKMKSPLFYQMSGLLQESPPMVQRWRNSVPLTKHMDDTFKLEHASTCVCFDSSLLPGDLYWPCVDIVSESDLFKGWFDGLDWKLSGLLIYKAADEWYEVIPIINERHNPDAIIPEMQLTFTKGTEGWSWERSNLGPVNSFFHNVFLKTTDDAGREEIAENVEYLGNVISLALGTYAEHLDQPGEWELKPPKSPRVKMKNGKVKKMFDMGTVGYAEFKPKPYVTPFDKIIPPIVKAPWPEPSVIKPKETEDGNDSNNA